ncbi:hypothetical protein [Nodosilinea sp. P-1105]|uniref:hypothetical protein n=1 Tax=Nodosilinea sp. P-1105 TaxID=2546229 RepID=UPI00146DD541|nr:hypothetical protein [Nodosilinea sp. P-1105]NMF82415.1 hypothetical protein [Nodosilinea sp. P-1105]
MRRPISRYDIVLRLLGAIAKGLFIAMFSCTVLVIVAALLGAAAPAWEVYTWVWSVCWRTGLMILALIAVVTMLDSWQ